MANFQKSFAGVSLSDKGRNKKILLTLFAAVLLRVVSGDGDYQTLPVEAHTVVKSSCSSTLYPELCYSAIAAAAHGVGEMKMPSCQKDVIEMTLNITVAAVERNSAGIGNLISKRRNLTRRADMALHDCLQTLEDTVDEINKVLEYLTEYPSTKKPARQHADDLKILMSAAITQQETCIDGFSHNTNDRHVREELIDGQDHVAKMCSNALAMIRNMTDSDMANNFNNSENENDSQSGWPEWVSAGDRRLLQASGVKADVVVAADGSGKYRTVTEAVANAPTKSNRRYVIRIKAGVYRENVEVPKTKTNIMFVGDGRSKTIITGNRNVVDGSTTFHSATVAVDGERFLARDITFRNTAGPTKHQAVALRVSSDFSAFYRCGVIGYQDTLYAHTNRHFFINCFISGTVDFIFGNAAVVLQDCDIHARLPGPGQSNMLTAQGRSDPNQNTGIVIQNCRIGATSDLKPVQNKFPTYLGRPWKQYSRTVIMQSSIGDVIHPAGWNEWDGSFALNTLSYREFRNTGPGANTSKRINWRGFKVISTPAEAQAFTPGRFIAGGSWLRGTGFPFNLGL